MSQQQQNKQKKGADNQNPGNKKNKKVIVHNHNYYGSQKATDNHLIRTEQEKKQVEQSVGIKSDDKTIVDYQKSKFDDFARRANALFDSSDDKKEVMSEDATYTVFTDAYSTEGVAPIAMKWYEMYHDQIPDSFMKFDAVTFIAYCEATCQLMLMSNDEIVGVHGFTREMVGDAKALLENWYVPDCVAVAIQGFRPITVIDTDCKFVLLPYQFQNGAGQLINHQQGFTHIAAVPGGAPAHFDAVLVPESFWRKEIGQLAVQIPVPGNVPQGAFRRKSLFLEYMNAQAQHQLIVGMQAVTAAVVNAFVGHTITSLSSAGYDLFGPTFRRNVVCIRNVYETVQAVSGKLLKLTNVCKLCTGLGAGTFHVARLKDRLPIQISSTGQGDVVRWMEYEPGEKLTPWFTTDTQANAIGASQMLTLASGMFTSVIKVPRNEWMNDLRYLGMVDTLAVMIKGKSGPFTALRAHPGF